MLAEQTRDGARPSGTLVENRIRNCVVRDSRRAAFWLGEVANGKLTDGELSNCIAAQHESAREAAVLIGHAAGWTINGLHTYGGLPKSAVMLGNPYFTNAANLYIEAFGTSAIELSGVQTTAALSNVHVVGGEQTDQSAFLTISGHPDFEGSTVLLNNVAFWHTRARPITAVAVMGKRAKVAGTPQIAGPGAASVKPGALQGSDAGPGSLSLGRGFTRSWEGRAQRQFEIAAHDVGEPFQLSFVVAITGRSTDGGLVTSCSCVVHWARMRANGPALADLVDTAPRQGFEREPHLTLERQGDQISVLMTFTPAASGVGLMSVSPI